MDDIDDTDREILELLLDDARRPFSEIADQVNLSGPAVSDRVARLQERGLICGFTLDLDRSMLREGQPMLVTIEAKPGAGPDVHSALLEDGSVQHAFRTVDDGVVVSATIRDGDVAGLLDSVGVIDRVRDYGVRLLAESSWSPTLGAAELAPECAECGNTVDDEGTTATLDGDQYYFCCSSCESNFTERYVELREGA